MFQTFESCYKSFLILVIVGSVIASPMYYKKKENDTYEPDLIAVSSTVIPLAEYRVNSSGIINYQSPALSEEYKIAYMKHMHKKAHEDADDPDTLITLRKKYHHQHEKSKLKTSKDEEATVVIAAPGAKQTIQI